jgi:hypothetical protein
LDGCNIQISAGWNGTQDNNGKKRIRNEMGRNRGWWGGDAAAWTSSRACGGGCAALLSLHRRTQGFHHTFIPLDFLPK